MTLIYTVTLNPAVDQTVRSAGFVTGRVNRIERVRTDPGGKGINVSRTLRALGGQSVAMGLLGGENGKYILRCLREEGVETDFVETGEETRSNLKIIDTLSGTVTEANEPGAAADPARLDALRGRLLARAGQGDLVVLAGKAPPGCGGAILRHWARDCMAAGARVFLDAEGELLREGVEAAPYLVKPNREELERLAGRPLSDEAALVRAARELLEAGVERVAVSCGEEGALFVCRDGVLRGGGLSVPVQSTVGAGDAMVAALAYGTERAEPWEETAARALAVSAAAAMRSGSQPARMRDVEALLQRVRIERVSPDR